MVVTEGCTVQTVSTCYTWLKSRRKFVEMQIPKRDNTSQLEGGKIYILSFLLFPFNSEADR